MYYERDGTSPYDHLPFTETGGSKMINIIENPLDMNHLKTIGARIARMSNEQFDKFMEVLLLLRQVERSVDQVHSFGSKCADPGQ